MCRAPHLGNGVAEDAALALAALRGACVLRRVYVPEGEIQEPFLAGTWVPCIRRSSCGQSRERRLTPW